MPAALVVTVALAAKVPEAPEPGAANVTDAPATGLPKASATLACKAVANAVLIVALCGVPALALMPAAAPAVFVSAKLADEVAPVVVAVTVYVPATVFAVSAGAVAIPLPLVVTVVLPPK